LFGSAVLYAIGSGLVGLVPLILLPFLTRFFSPEDYGRVAMFAVTVQFLSPFTGLSVQGAVGMRYFQQDRLDFPAYVFTCLVILAVSAGSLVLITMFSPSLLVEQTGLARQWLLLAVVTSGAYFVVQIQLTIWQSSKQSLSFALMRVSQAVLDLGFSLLFILALSLGWEGRALGSAAAIIIAMAIAIQALWRGGWITPRFRRRYAINALRFGVPLIPHAVGGMLIATVDRFLITNILGVGETGIYLVAVQIGLSVNLITDAINRAASPWLIEGLEKQNVPRDRLIVRVTYLYFIAVLAAACFLGLVAPALLDILAGERFRAAGSLVLFIVLGQAFNGMYQVLSNYIFWAGLTAKLAWITLSSGLLNILVSYVLLSRYGLVGAAEAFMIAQFLLLIGAWWLAHRSRPMPWIQALRFTKS
jgi:O-antigen/teichoic acid export membrane protein